VPVDVGTGAFEEVGAATPTDVLTDLDSPPPAKGTLEIVGVAFVVVGEEEGRHDDQEAEADPEGESR
jgi:hypothetical protein